MKKIKISSILAVGAAVMMTSCGTGTIGNVLNSTTGTTTSSTTNEALLSSLLGNVIGQLTSQTSSSIEGTWVYSAPAVQFESSNFLAQAGGQVAAQTVVSKVQPYFEKMGLTKGKVKVIFNSDKTCSYVFNNTQYSGTYTYDSSTGALVISGGTTGVAFPTCYATSTGSQMNVTFKDDKIISLLQNVGAKTTNSTLSSVSSIASMFDGMQIGFQFTKQ